MDHVLDLLHAALGQLRDVDHAVLTGGQLHEGTEVQDADDLAVIQHPDLGDEDDGVDHLLGDVAAGGDVSGLLRSLGEIHLHQQKIRLLRRTLPDHIVAVVGEDAQRTAASQITQPVRRAAGHGVGEKADRRARQLRAGTACRRLPLSEQAHTAVSFLRVTPAFGKSVPHSGQYTA